MNTKKNFSHLKKMGKNERNMKKNLNRFSEEARNEEKMRKKIFNNSRSWQHENFLKSHKLSTIFFVSIFILLFFDL